MGIIGLIDASFRIITQVLTPLAFALCLLYFFWGLVKYIRVGAQSEEAAKEGRQVMVWGTVGLFVVFSVWGIITFIQNELGVPPIQNVDRQGTPYVNSNINYQMSFIISHYS